MLQSVNLEASVGIVLHSVRVLPSDEVELRVLLVTRG